MTRNQKAVQLFVSCNIKTCNAKKLAEKHGVDRRDLSYLNAISSLVSSDCFKFICDAVMRGEYISTDTGERTRSLEMLVRILRNGSNIITEIDHQMVLYVVEADSKYKIGVAKSISSRLRLLQTGNPYKISVYKEYKISTEPLARGIEKELHSMFNSKRMEGEWFNLVKDDLELLDQYVKSVKNG